MGGRLRGPLRLGGGHEADGVVPAVAVPGVDGPLSRPSGVSRRWPSAGWSRALTLYAFNPPWWPDPIGGVSAFFTSNLTRGQTIPIRSMYPRQILPHAEQSLPWYNTLVWTAVRHAGRVPVAGALGAIPRALRKCPFGTVRADS